MARLLSLDRAVSFIQGNGEIAVLEARSGLLSEPLPEHAHAVVRWAARALSAEDAAVVASWPLQVTLPIDGIGDVLFCHGTPRHPNEIFIASTPEARSVRYSIRSTSRSSYAATRTCPSIVASDATRVVNAGSIGMPFGEPGRTGCCWDQTSISGTRSTTSTTPRNGCGRAATLTRMLSPPRSLNRCRLRKCSRRSPVPS